uniref:NADH-ubiquinone oxidoreductase chain 4L n=1 Tax=Euthalenessa festiva TaxID=2153328 RepID=A0A343W6K2_9ANNE|nr:NADH dehydrogenase subunit 4L [Euthalenessa festiva]
MTFMSSSLIPLAPLVAILTMIIQRSHILMSLLALEAMILSLALASILLSSSVNPMEMFLALILLTFGACEASLGLACIVALARATGNDQISSSSLSKC